MIIVSLVRSNLERKVGFLRTENRINMLLSRAQYGIYLIGNSETYLNVPMWADIHAQLTRTNAVGTQLALCCPRHPEISILCSEPHEFETKSPEGGCNILCTRRLEPCGHRCQAKCHSSFMHHGFACCKPCSRIRKTCDHACPKLCGEECGLCMVEIRDVTLPCGHVKKKLMCHQMHNLASIKCDVKVDKVITKCGHVLRLACFVDVTSEIFSCTEPCTEILGCGHNCGGVCGKCLKEGENGVVSFEHPTCTKKCDRPLGICNHRCPKVCHDGEGCGNCEAKCEVSLDSSISLIYIPGYSCIMLTPKRFDAHTQLVPPPAERHVHLVSRHALGFVLTKVPAQCHVQHRVIDFRAMSDARKSSIAVISARVFAEKTVQVACVKNAVTSQTLVSTSLNGNVILKSTSTRVQLSCSAAAISLPVSRSMVLSA